MKRKFRYPRELTVKLLKAVDRYQESQNMAHEVVSQLPISLRGKRSAALKEAESSIVEALQGILEKLRTLGAAR